MAEERLVLTKNEVTGSRQASGDEEKKEQSSLTSASFNFINTIIGSGILGMPYALRQAGVGLGLMLFVLVAWMTDASILMLVRAGNLAGTSTYQDTVMRALGPPGYYVLVFLQFTYPFVALLSYNIIIGDNFTKVLLRMTGVPADNLVVRREFIIIASTLLITLPLSLYKNIGKLAKVSLLSFLIILTVIVALIYRTTTIPVAEDAWVFGKGGVVQAAGVLAFMFMCHHNAFLIYCSLDEATEERWARVSHFSIIVCAAVAAVFGVSGFVLFNSYSLGNLLENYCWHDDLMNVMRLLYTITILFTYPMECFVTREVIENTFFITDMNRNEPHPWSRHVLLTVIICFSVGIISLLVECLGAALAINGTLFATPLAFVLPPICYIRLSPEKLASRTNVVPLVVLVIGTAMGVCGIVEAFMHLSDYSSECNHGQEMFYCSANQTWPGHSGPRYPDQF
ncbi:putative sodium-coupled neutral amino acid transporter 11 [Amphibalanus amphitrite]|uniref:Putative sodium-coupled neutral amino acid transporter 11 n=1 Tax=Amphibalanus amphitrite TaxID=1232801 RepID=A0A6A4VUQ0_AMPAM|nr:putative sodium-coupled neutral amino acid transporter 11 [Amphibalanus amphitrite]